MSKEVWAFDAEWVPDAATGRAVYGLNEISPDAEVIEAMWRHGGATEDEPRPYLKTVLCRVVCISAVIRKSEPGAAPRLTLFSLPQPEQGCAPEAILLERFLAKIGESKPQLVGYNSKSADLPILLQRALVHRLHQPGMCRRPNKPWEGIDYFARWENDYHTDLKEELGTWGKTVPTLHEVACACGIPGKFSMTGTDVLDLWRVGNVWPIVQYNQCDALSTYLLWLRLAHLAGLLSSQDFLRDESALEDLLLRKGQQPHHEHLMEYLRVWHQLRAGRPK